ncbi:MAG: hypothetical protein AAF433_10125 [Bacteroidota bacterium]
MYQFQSEQLEGGKVFKYQCLRNGELMSVMDFISDLKSEEQFSIELSTTITNCPFPALFFETPPMIKERLSQSFEFVLVASKSLTQVQANSHAFADYFTADEVVVSFPNLGGDAQLIVPCPIGKTKYAHLKDFLATAAPEQLMAFWKKTAMEYQTALGDAPKWLSTAGLGVSWLHLRIDSRPKYYRHTPYKQL